MKSVGFNALSTTLSIAGMNIVILLSEVPSGILADRWSRKNVMVSSMFVLTLAAVVYSVANSPAIYLLGILLYGLHLALFSGLNETIIYDSLLEINKKRTGYEKWFGYARLVNSVALVLGSLAGGLVAKRYGLHGAYLLSLPSCVAGVIVATFIKEPAIHSKNQATYLLHHISQTFRVVWRRDTVGWVVLSAVSLGALLMFLLEVDQLWLIALALPLVWYGPVNALLLIGYGLSGSVANKLVELHLRAKLVGALGVVAMLLLTINNVHLVIIGQAVGITIFSSFQIIANGRLHDAVPSRFRAGAASMVSTLTTIIFLPLAYIFGHLAQSHNISIASYLLIPLALVSCVSFFIPRRINA